MVTKDNPSFLPQATPEQHLSQDDEDERESSKSKSSHRSKESSESKKRESEKRNIDKERSFLGFLEWQVEEYLKGELSPLKQELSELSGASEAKKPKLEPSSVSPAHKPGTPEHRSDKERDRDRDRDKDRDRDRDSHKHKDKERSKEHKYKDKDRHDRDKEREKEKEKEKEKERKKHEIAKARKICSSDDSSSESDTDNTQAKLDTDNFAVDMGIACVVCKQFDVQSGNQLVECQECHSLYHQECHRPPVTEKDVNDPRFVWYCTKCTKNMKKVVTKPQKGKSSSHSSKEPVHESTFLKPVKAEAASLLQPFRRLETSKPSTGKESSRPFIGLAGLAANLSHKTDTKTSSGSKSSSSSVKLDPSKSGLAALASAASSKSSSKYSSSSSASGGGSSSKGSGSSSSGTSGSGSNSKNTGSMLNAEKRMQMMKKKAAAKQQDKKNAYK